MSYLEQLKKSENAYPDALSKLTKGGFDSFDSRGERHFPEKKAPCAVTDLATPTGPRTVTVTGNDTPTGDRITAASIYTGRPTPEAVDIADAALTFMSDKDRPCTEREITAAVGGDPIMARNILHRLAVDGIAEALPGGLYQIPAYPPRAADLPAGCPLLAGPVPAGCCFHPKLLARLLAEGALPLPSGRCPLRTACKVGRENGVKC